MVKAFLSCYTVNRIKGPAKHMFKVQRHTKVRAAVDMKSGKKLLPEGWLPRVLVIAGAALAGNLLLRVVPWPDWIRTSYESAAAMDQAEEGRYLFMTLLLAPAVEEGVFRLFLFGWLFRERLGFWGAAVLSSLSFGLYHGNWIQGVYGFFLGVILAWGYESSAYGKYRMAVIMHGAANLAVLVIFV